MSVNLPKTHPLWIDQRLLDGEKLTHGEEKISEMQTEVLKKTLNTLNQPVAEGDMKAAKARVDSLKEQFKSLSPPMKEYLYNVLQTDMGSKDLADVFHYKLSSSSRDTLLKILNPNHSVDQIKKETVNDAKAKASKTLELNVQGSQFEQKLKEFLDEHEKDQWKPQE